MNWQPIDTAPKDGTSFLAFEDGDVYQCCWGPEAWDQSWRPLVLNYHGCGCCGGGKIAFTHWMPLPEPPK
jgi:hypothetical protein